MEKVKENLELNKTEKGKRSSSFKWLVCGACIALFFSFAFTALYDNFRTYARQYNNSPMETVNNLLWIYQSNYLLYRDLYNKVNETNIDYMELYLQPSEDSEWIWEECYMEYFSELENCFSSLNANYDYFAQDLITGAVVSNFDYENFQLQEQYFCISFLFDEAGNVTVDNIIQGVDIAQLRKNINEVIRGNGLRDIAQRYCYDSEMVDFPSPQLKPPKNCRITYCVSNEAWEKRTNAEYSVYYNNNSVLIDRISYGTSDYDLYIQAGAGTALTIIMLIVFLLAMFVPCVGNIEEAKLPWNRVAMPLEAIVLAICILFALGSEVISMVAAICSGAAEEAFSYIFQSGAGIIVYCLNILALWVYFFFTWFLSIQLRALRAMGIMQYIRKRCLIYRIFPFLKGKILKMYDAVAHFDVTKNAHKMILKIVLVNAVVLFIISSLWFGGFAITVVYSILLYFALRKYISDLQKKYSLLLKATNEMAEGNLNVAITEDLGVFEPFKPQIFRIQRGFKKAVENETKSQRMKAELITNVSHDLKTPLTAIITYISLLKEPNITEEQRREYLDILERKSLRLKVLIEDLFEVSKANSHSISLHITDVDIMNLIKQVAFEMSDKLEAAKLDLRMNLSEEKILLPLDSQKTYRIYENLFGNIAKYALKGTRVYVNGFRIDDTVVITLKNIAADEIQVKPEELTDRFVRGDTSRNTEGSGLGLAIAKSFLELQGGEISIELDGDLFKVTTTFKM